MNKTEIDWADYSWNPVTGCLRGCFYCYVRRLADRFNYSMDPMFHEKRIKEHTGAKPGSRIFVCSTGDLFGEWVPDEWINRVLAEVKSRPDVIFQFLTKNPRRYNYFQFPDNCWLGMTVTADIPWSDMRKITGFFMHTGVKFISYEPLIRKAEFIKGVDWIIIGAMTGKDEKAYPPKPEWIKHLIDSADKNNVPVFMKDNLIRHRGSNAWRKEFPE